MNERVHYWLELAEYDLDTARAMLQAGRYLYVGFMCHQVVEKMLKAYYVRIKDGVPPYTHNLALLAAESTLEIQLHEDQVSHIRQLEPLNIECRYPADREVLAKALTLAKCQSLLRATEEMFEWIRQRLSE